MWKNIVELGRFQTTIRWMRIACWIHKTTNTLKICNNYCFSTVKMVARTDLNIMLHVYCLSYLRYIPTRDKATSLLMFLDPTQLDTHPHSRTQTHTNTLTHTNTYTHSRTQKHTLTHANTHIHSRTQTHTHTHTVVLLWKRDQLVADAAVYTTHKRHKGKTPKFSAVLEPAIPVMESLRQHGNRHRRHVYYGNRITNFMYKCYMHTNIT